jgi:hypothetical protein
MDLTLASKSRMPCAAGSGFSSMGLSSSGAREKTIFSSEGISSGSRGGNISPTANSSSAAAGAASVSTAGVLTSGTGVGGGAYLISQSM